MFSRANPCQSLQRCPTPLTAAPPAQAPSHPSSRRHPAPPHACPIPPSVTLLAALPAEAQGPALCPFSRAPPGPARGRSRHLLLPVAEPHAALLHHQRLPQLQQPAGPREPVHGGRASPFPPSPPPADQAAAAAPRPPPGEQAPSPPAPRPLAAARGAAAIFPQRQGAPRALRAPPTQRPPPRDPCRPGRRARHSRYRTALPPLASSSPAAGPIREALYGGRFKQLRRRAPPFTTAFIPRAAMTAKPPPRLPASRRSEPAKRGKAAGRPPGGKFQGAEGFFVPSARSRGAGCWGWLSLPRCAAAVTAAAGKGGAVGGGELVASPGERETRTGGCVGLGSSGRCPGLRASERCEWVDAGSPSPRGAGAGALPARPSFWNESLPAYRKACLNLTASY